MNNPSDTQPLQYDQHFLTDPTVIHAMIQALDLIPTDTILELGPGTGAITKELAKYKNKILAIEKDEELQPHLTTLPQNVTVIYGEALDKIMMLHYTKIIGNLPFSMVEPLFRILHKQSFTRAVLLIGEQFYTNFQQEGLWKSLIDSFYDVEQVLPVPATSFNPQPKTAGIILVLQKKEHTSIIKEFLLQDDKKVKNALLYSYVHQGATKKQAKAAIATFNLAPQLLEKPSNMISNKEFLLIKEHLKTTPHTAFTLSL